METSLCLGSNLPKGKMPGAEQVMHKTWSVLLDYSSKNKTLCI